MTADAGSTTELAAELDERLTVPVVVVGSLPGLEARDLDLVVLTADHVSVHDLLVNLGFERRGGTYARFVGSRVDVVDVLRSDQAGLTEDVAARMVRESRPLDGFRHVRRPAPHDAVLWLARQSAGDTTLTARRRARLEEALAEPGTWDRARDRAAAWGLSSALAHLADLRAGRGRLRGRLDALTERRARRGDRWARLRAWRQVLHRPRGHLIAVCGLDGAGKSTQVEALARTLAVLGHEPVVVWTRFGSESWLRHVARPVKRVLARLTSSSWDTRVPAAAPRAAGTSAGVADDVTEPGGVVRRLVRDGWALLLVLANARAHRRATRHHLRAGRVVVCDRYVLDSAVHVRYRYAPHRTFGAHVALLRWRSPRPTWMVLLEISGETAWRRKQDHYDARQLILQASLYDQEARRAGVDRLDGTRPREELGERIARSAWHHLRG